MADDIVRQRLVQSLYDIKVDRQTAVRYIESHTEELAQALLHAYRLSSQYVPGDSPEKAVYLLAQIHLILGKDAPKYVVIEEYDERQRKLQEYDRRQEIARAG